ncbi:hypothetical protein A3H04_03020 [Candidatus Giovannonibacteria bacterium RIFCSPLOWO2_12_FULL_43_11c]|nr:MAG: hypothetical protein A3B97_04345 [Candidatus Giovannonibacteria bacterium RIFCSPHIGHO2_02_FULL_43_32]OGF91949.1 MAG: hypothetical protein A3H04_03020 [Candidatus Giovannonibacteria bacterium RIFCSPLOWO2_12_FULL_43_11c]
MVFDQHAILGFIAVAIGIVGYIPYYRDIFRGTTKPHPFTWIGFGLLNAVTFVAQVVTGGGPGAWVTAITTVATFGIAIFAFRQGEKKITIFDWICFCGALMGIVLWKMTSDPFSAVVIVTIADLLAFAPTFRKAFLRPNEETATLYFMSVLKYGISLFALTIFSLTTAFFPVAITIANSAIVILILTRRGQTLKSHFSLT